MDGTDMTNVNTPLRCSLHGCADIEPRSDTIAWFSAERRIVTTSVWELELWLAYGHDVIALGNKARLGVKPRACRCLRCTPELPKTSQKSL